MVRKGRVFTSSSQIMPPPAQQSHFVLLHSQPKLPIIIAKAHKYTHSHGTYKSYKHIQRHPQEELPTWRDSCQPSSSNLEEMKLLATALSSSKTPPVSPE